MNRVVVPGRQATQTGEIDSLESIFGLLKSLKNRTRVWGKSPFLLQSSGGGGGYTTLNLV
jgi:hypothetical protein